MPWRHQIHEKMCSLQDDESAAQELDYASQTARIAKRARLALVNRQIDELSKAKTIIAKDYRSADAQLVLAEVK